MIRTSAQLRNSFGLNCHFERVDLPPWQRSQEVCELYLQLGVKHHRGDLYTHADAYMTDRYHESMRTLAAGGVRFTWLMGAPHLTAPRYGGGPEALAEVARSEYAGATYAYEGPNEPDNPWANPGAVYPDWAKWTREHMARLFQAAALLPGRPVLAPSVIHSDSPAKLGDMTGLANQPNVHPYTGNRHPRTAQTAEQRAFAKPMFPADIASRDLYATETGFTTATTPNGGWPAITEKQQAILTLRMILSNARAGFRRSFYYDFVDDGKTDEHEHRFGLVRHDLTPKPAYYAVQRLLALCGGPTTAKPLSWAWVGAPAVPVRALKLTNRDGSHTLFMWHEAALGHPPTKLTLKFPNSTQKTSYDLIGGAAPCSSALPAALPVVLADEPLALKVI